METAKSSLVLDLIEYIESFISNFFIFEDKEVEDEYDFDYTIELNPEVYSILPLDVTDVLLKYLPSYETVDDLLEDLSNIVIDMQDLGFDGRFERVRFSFFMFRRDGRLILEHVEFLSEVE